jgi:hypothetical protein
MRQTPSSEAGSLSASQEVILLSSNPKVLIVFTGPYSEPDEYSSPHPHSLFSSYSSWYPPIYACVFSDYLFRSDFSTKILYAFLVFQLCNSETLSILLTVHFNIIIGLPISSAVLSIVRFSFDHVYPAKGLKVLVFDSQF